MQRLGQPPSVSQSIARRAASLTSRETNSGQSIQASKDCWRSLPHSASRLARTRADPSRHISIRDAMESPRACSCRRESGRALLQRAHARGRRSNLHHPEQGGMFEPEAPCGTHKERFVGDEPGETPCGRSAASQDRLLTKLHWI